MIQYPSSFDLSERDSSVVRLVARFKQLASSHVHALLYSSTSSRTPADRALKRLTDRDYLHRIERRTVGGARGGSGQFVYALGRRGFYLFNEGRYVPARAVNYHALAIADAYVTLSALERQARLTIEGHSTEPDCWVTIGRTELKPDLFVDLVYAGERLQLWLEIDMGTESQVRIREKLERYWRAYELHEAEVFPLTLFVAIDAERAKELRWVISQGTEEQAALFRVTTLRELPALFP